MYSIFLHKLVFISFPQESVVTTEHHTLSVKALKALFLDGNNVINVILFSIFVFIVFTTFPKMRLGGREGFNIGSVEETVGLCAHCGVSF